MDLHGLKDLILNDELNVKDEYVIFEVIVRWLGFDYVRRIQVKLILRV